ncbi:TOM1-like protein [Drosera capensis]
MASNAATLADRATNDMLIGPDLAVNMDLCDTINMDPGQAKDALKIIKKRLASKNPKVQVLALSVLDTLGKNCGEIVFRQIVERDILHDMVKIVKKKPDLSVREMILMLIDTWQEALGATRGKYTQYYNAYNELKTAGVDFPPRGENSVPLFTPPQTQPIAYSSTTTTDEDRAIEASLHFDNSALSSEEMKNAKGLADVLLEILSALDPKTPEGVKQEVVVDLVEQCRTYQQRVLTLVSNTSNEELLFQGLALNDDLQHVLRLHDDIVKGAASGFSEPKGVPSASLLNVNHEEDESEDEVVQLARRPTRESAKPLNQPGPVSPLIPPPPSSKRPIYTDPTTVDYLSGEAYGSQRSPETETPTAFSVRTRHGNTSLAPPLGSSNPPSSTAPHFTGSTSPPKFESNPIFDDPTPLSRSDGLASGHWDPPATFLPPPPSRYNQRQQIFEQQNPFSGGASHSSGGSGSSYDSLVGETQNLSINSSTPHNDPKPEDALFQDLVDFAKSKSSMSKSSFKRRS